MSILAAAAPLPQRYAEEGGTEFWGFVNDALHRRVSILDVGTGRRRPRLRSLYMGYEDWAIRRGHINLATHYARAVFGTSASLI